jgi:hypothetical protein
LYLLTYQALYEPNAISRQAMILDPLEGTETQSA